MTLGLGFYYDIFQQMTFLRFIFPSVYGVNAFESCKMNPSSTLRVDCSRLFSLFLS